MAFALLFLCAACNTNNSQKGIKKAYRNVLLKTLDFSTSSNYLVIKVGKNDSDTMTVVIPSEILGRYLRDNYPTDKSYTESIIAAAKGKYLRMSSDHFDLFESYKVNFTDGFVASWCSKRVKDIIDKYFQSDGGVTYACFNDGKMGNQVCYLLIEKGANVFMDDETGCVVVEPMVHALFFSRLARACPLLALVSFLRWLAQD